MSDVLTTLAAVVQPWADTYNEHSTLQALVMFAHVGGLLLSGGTAIVMDRATLTAGRGTPDDRSAQLQRLHTSHGPVLAGLGLTVLSGFLLLAADLEVLAAAPAFWIKMALFVALMANGALLTRVARSVASTDVTAMPGTEGPSSRDGAWGRLLLVTRTSLVLWFAIVLASTLLVTSA